MFGSNMCLFTSILVAIGLSACVDTTCDAEDTAALLVSVDEAHFEKGRAQLTRLELPQLIAVAESVLRHDSEHRMETSYGSSATPPRELLPIARAHSFLPGDTWVAGSSPLPSLRHDDQASAGDAVDSVLMCLDKHTPLSDGDCVALCNAVAANGKVSIIAKATRILEKSQRQAPFARTYLMTLLNHNELGIVAAKALSTWPNDDLNQMLVEVLSEHKRRIATRNSLWIAATVLGSWNPRLCEAVASHLDSDDLARYSAFALSRDSAYGIPALLARIRKRMGATPACLAALSTCNPEVIRSLEEELITLLHSSDDTIAQLAAQCLALANDRISDSAVRTIIAFASSGRDAVRLPLLEGLGWFAARHDAALPILKRSLGPTLDINLRVAAIRGLGHCEKSPFHDEAMQIVRDLARDKSLPDEVRTEAALLMTK